MGKFKELLERNGMSGYRLAKLTGLSQPNIARWVSDKRDPLSMSLDSAGKVSQVLGITIDELYKALR